MSTYSKTARPKSSFPARAPTLDDAGETFLVEFETSGVLVRAWCPAAVMNDELRLVAPSALSEPSRTALWATLDRMIEQVLGDPGIDPHSTFPTFPPSPGELSQSALSFRAAVLRGWLEGRLYSEMKKLPIDATTCGTADAFAIATSIARRNTPCATSDTTQPPNYQEESPTMAEAKFANTDMIADRVHWRPALQEEWVKLTHLRDECRLQQETPIPSTYALQLFDDSRRRVTALVAHDPIWAREIARRRNHPAARHRRGGSPGCSGNLARMARDRAHGHGGIGVVA